MFHGTAHVFCSFVCAQASSSIVRPHVWKPLAAWNSLFGMAGRARVWTMRKAARRARSTVGIFATGSLSLSALSSTSAVRRRALPSVGGRGGLHCSLTKRFQHVQQTPTPLFLFVVPNGGPMYRATPSLLSCVNTSPGSVLSPICRAVAGKACVWRVMLRPVALELSFALHGRSLQ